VGTAGDEVFFKETQPIAAHKPGDFARVTTGIAQAALEIWEIAVVPEPVRLWRKSGRGGAAFAVIDVFAPAPVALPVDHTAGVILAQIGACAEMLRAELVRCAAIIWQKLCNVQSGLSFTWCG
jgi:hypothetical protein